MKAKKPRRAGRLTAEEAARIPDRLLDAATELFTAAGYANTTMEAIARKAGASSKTVYSRFANKEEVLAAVVRRLFDRSVPAEPQTGPVQNVAESPRAFLLRVGRELATLSEARETAGLNRLIMAEAFRFPELASLFIDLHERAVAIIRGPLETWHRDGLLPNLPSSRLASMLFVEMAASTPRIRSLLGQPMSKRESSALLATAVDIFLRGCGHAETDKPGGGMA